MRSKLMTGALVGAVGFLLVTNPVVVEAAGQITSGQIKNNTIKSKDIKDNQVKSVDVKNGALGSVDLADGSVTPAKLAAGSQPRLAVSTGLASMSATSSGVNIGDVALTTGGTAGKNQLVKVDVAMQLDHDDPIAAGCSASWQLTRDASPTVLNSWSVEFYAGAIGEEPNLAFSLLTTQASGTTSTYHLLASNSCSQTLFTDWDVMTAQAFALTGAGVAPARGAVHRPSTPGHDR